MAKAIMVQGTMSNAGKSILVAALCRIFTQDGLKTAPFKSQNMALNSYLTRDGFEVGRATGVQAEAAGIDADPRMNPILLKPTTDTTSAVIVNGRPWANMSAAEYFESRRTETKQVLLGEVMAAYQSLADDFDVIVLEGAGSPVELNLRDRDIVNMTIARLVSSPVLLVGDIDRGGVFAQLFGTVELLQPEERALVKGLIVNKFRGDIELFKPGIAILEEKCKVPVVGVVPYLDVDIEDEDSVSGRLARSGAAADIDIAVLNLPRISNFTDFAALEASAGVGVRYVRRVSELGDPDLLVLPGTSNLISDLALLREQGWEQALLAAAGRGTPVFGIGGGYHLLGQAVTGLDGERVQGLGLLPIETRLTGEQTSRQSAARFLGASGELGALAELGGVEFAGYAIGAAEVTLRGDAAPLVQLGDSGVDGCYLGNVYGLSLHGCLDGAAVRDALLAALYRLKGKAAPTGSAAFDLAEYKREQFDKLADGVRASLDMELVYRILNGS